MSEVITNKKKECETQRKEGDKLSIFVQMKYPC